MEKEKIKDIMEWIYCIVIAVVLALLVRYYIGTPTIVKMVSMKPTLMQNDRLILNRWSRTTKQEIKRGEIITLEAPIKSYSYITADQENPVAIFRERKGAFSKFVYYVLELGKTSYIKRVIGLPGEHLQIQNGKVYINGEELQEEYLKEGVKTESQVFTDIIVPEGYVFAMGDNRAESMDSRVFGCIPIDKIESKVLIRFWPLNKIGKVN